jgi:hypothetical protein
VALRVEGHDDVPGASNRLRRVPIDLLRGEIADVEDDRGQPLDPLVLARQRRPEVARDERAVAVDEVNRPLDPVAPAPVVEAGIAGADVEVGRARVCGQPPRVGSLRLREANGSVERLDRQLRLELRPGLALREALIRFREVGRFTARVEGQRGGRQREKAQQGGGEREAWTDS